MNQALFIQAVGLARSGRKAEARDLFLELLKEDRANEMAWLWYVECIDTPAERIQALEICSRINPQAQRVRRKLLALLKMVPLVA
jgi:thioredoxin-like negative regulator of GroEL